MKEQLGKYYIDLSKLVFGGSIVSAIMKEDISLVWIIAVGGTTVVLLATAGFLLLKKKK
jgi:LPXTG-motif cell wall-anchored protein